jgi:hypothetical protein
MVSLYLCLLSISMKVMNKGSLWSGKDLGKSVLGTSSLQIRGQPLRSASFPTLAGVTSQAGTSLHPGYSALAGVALRGLPAVLSMPTVLGGRWNSQRKIKHVFFLRPCSSVVWRC